MKGIIYYTANRIEDVSTPGWNDELIAPWVRRELLKTGLPIVNVSLKPLDFGKNIVLNMEPGMLAMTTQILTALKASEADVIYFCEDDILYPQCHFEKEPADKDTFCYNLNSWKWDSSSRRCIFHEDVVGLHALCVYRDKAIEHYQKKLDIIYERGYDKLPISRNPRWARDLGYEPGKPPKWGGVAAEKTELWTSKEPIINIRHPKTMTPRKMRIEDYKRVPKHWQESTIEKLWKNQ